MSDERDNSIDVWMREVSEKLGKLQSDVDTIHDTCDRVEAQTTKTNGRVTILEKWRSFLAGGWALIAIIGGIIASLIEWHK